MPPKLARSIRENGCQSINKHSRTQRIRAAESKLLHISGQFAQLVEEFAMTFTDRDLIPTVYAILENGCPNLNRLELCCQPMKFSDINDKLVAPLNTQDKLTSIGITDFSKGSDFLKMTQLILNSAPNLKYFTYLQKISRFKSERGNYMDVIGVRLYEIQQNPKLHWFSWTQPNAGSS